MIQLSEHIYLSNPFLSTVIQISFHCAIWTGSNFCSSLECCLERSRAEIAPVLLLFVTARQAPYRYRCTKRACGPAKTAGKPPKAHYIRDT